MERRNAAIFAAVITILILVFYQIGYMAEGFVGVKEKDGVVDIDEITPGHFYILPKSVSITVYSTNEQRVDLAADITTSDGIEAEMYADVVYMLDGNKASELQQDYRNGKLSETIWKHAGHAILPAIADQEPQSKLPEAILAVAWTQAASNVSAKDLHIFDNGLEAEALANLQKNDLLRIYGLNVTHCEFGGIRLADELQERIEHTVRARQTL